MQTRIKVRGVPVWIGLYETEPGDWHALGTYRGTAIATTGTTEKNAIELWKSAAEVKAAAHEKSRSN